MALYVAICFLISILILFIVQLFLPAYFIYSLWRGRLDSKFAWLVKTLYSGAFILYVFLTGRWDWLSYYLRYLFIVLFVVAAFISYRRVSSLPFFIQDGRRWWQRFAWPILEFGIYPDELERYAIFEETVHSPCDGAVTEAVDGLPDHIPPAADREHPAGNHVVIACQDVQVVLAHLKNGSLQVQAGETVTTGQPLGQVGNSGNTSEPHLHIHAVQGDAPSVLEGEGTPILFEGNFPVRNTVYVE